MIIEATGLYATVTAAPSLTEEEAEAILSDPAAMRAVIDGSGTLPPASQWIKFHHYDEFCGGVAVLNILPNPLQVEFHLFYLSTAPKHLARIFCELAYIHSLLHRQQPYTVIRATPELQYMHNFMLRLGCKRVPNHGRYFYFLDSNWKPTQLTNFKVTYEHAT